MNSAVFCDGFRFAQGLDGGIFVNGQIPHDTAEEFQRVELGLTGKADAADGRERQRKAACQLCWIVQFGRAPMERPAEYSTLRTMWLQGEISAREAGRQLHVTHKTFLRWVKSENNG